MSSRATVLSMKKSYTLYFAFVLMAASLFADSSTKPSSRMGETWYAARHSDKLSQLSKKNVDIIFIGDSITERWESLGSKYWPGIYVTLTALNLGFRGDQTQHVLWRLENGQIDGISPKIAVLLIGTNNLSHTAQEVADGIEAICNTIKRKLPKTKILLLAILPRDDRGPIVRQKNCEINARISSLHDNHQIFFLDIGSHLLDGLGNVRRDLLPDLLHPNSDGYQLCAAILEPTLRKLLEN